MRDEEKTKEDLISDLNELRQKYTQLKLSLSTGQTKQNTPGTETILVVDDNDEARAIILSILEHYGYKTFEAGSSQKAVQILETCTEKIHLVLSDVVMPETNGPEMIKQLKEIKPDIKIVFMSGYAEDQIIHDEVFNILHSQIPFIKKPFTFDELSQTIRLALDQ